MRKTLFLKISLGLLFVFIIFVLPVWAESAYEEAIFIRNTDDGAVLSRDEGFHRLGNVTLLPDPSVVWSNYLAIAIYNTTSNTIDGHVFAGTYLNSPKEAELFASDGGGVPEWTYSGNEFYTDAGDDAFTLGAIDKDGSGVSVIKWTGAGDGTPDWTADFGGYNTTNYGPIAVSDNGSTIAAIASPPGTDAHLLLFDANSSTPLVNYEATGLGFPRYVKINADGRYTAFIALSTIVVFDRDVLSVRDQISMGATNSALDISGDGNLIAYGWSSFKVTNWNGSSYQELWSWSAGGYYVGRIAISTDGTTIVSCWYSSSFNTLKVVVHNPGSSTPLWVYDYPQSNGTYQETPGDVDITGDGRYFVVGSWGDAANLNPEVHIFQRDDTPHLMHTVDMPGSVFSVDISDDGMYATAAGKHIHANENGNGGDIVLIDTDLDSDVPTLSEWGMLLLGLLLLAIGTVAVVRRRRGVLSKV
ncbi:MAG: IPTL-CTERM sorting domain-containing protein [candidate division Zixibacteria bacterium]